MEQTVKIFSEINATNDKSRDFNSKCSDQPNGPIRMIWVDFHMNTFSHNLLGAFRSTLTHSFQTANPFNST